MAASSSLHLVRKGQGPAVVLLHSGGMSARQWRRLQDRLAPRFDVLAPDFLGSGDNPPWPAGEPFHFHQDVAQVEALLDALGAPAHLVGHSYGGLVALTVARRAPQRVRSLAVYDPVAFAVLEGDDAADVRADRAAADLLRDAADGGSATWMGAFIDYWSGAGTWGALPDESRAAFERVAPKVYLEVQSLLTDRTPLDAYRGLDLPALLLSGERTPRAAQRVTELLVSALPRATRAVIPGAGHMGPITHGEAVGAAIERHLDGA